MDKDKKLEKLEAEITELAATLSSEDPKSLDIGKPSVTRLALQTKLAELELALRPADEHDH